MRLSLASLFLLAVTGSAGPIASTKRGNVLRHANDEHRRWVKSPDVQKRQGGTAVASTSSEQNSVIPIPAFTDESTKAATFSSSPSKAQTTPAKLTTISAQTTVMTTLQTTMQVTVASFQSDTATAQLTPSQVSSVTAASLSYPSSSSTGSTSVSTPSSITIVFVTASPTFSGPIGGYTTLSHGAQQNQNLTAAAILSAPTAKTVTDNIVNGLSSVPASSSSSSASAKPVAVSSGIETVTGNIVNGLSSVPLSASSSISQSATASNGAGSYQFTVTNTGTIAPGLTSIPISAGTSTAITSVTKSSLAATDSIFTTSNAVNGLSSILASPFPPSPTTSSSQATETIIVPPNSDGSSSDAVPPPTAATASNNGILTLTGSAAPTTIATQASAAALSSLPSSAQAPSAKVTKATDISSDGLTVIPITPTGAVIPIPQSSNTVAALSTSLFVSTLSAEPKPSTSPQQIVTPQPTTFQTSTRSIQSQSQGDSSTPQQRTHHRSGTTTLTSTATTITMTVDSAGNPMGPTLTAASAQDTAGSSIQRNQQTQTEAALSSPSVSTMILIQSVTRTEFVNVPIIETSTVSVTQPAETITETATITQLTTVSQTIAVGATTVTESVVLTAR